jgi:hypothetical protein
MRFALVFAAVTLLGAAASSYVDTAARWRADYEASLKAPDGWLSVTGLVWLHDGENSVSAAPGKPVFVLHDHKVTLAGRGLLKSDATGHPDVIQMGDVWLTVIGRDGNIGIRVRDKNAPAVREFTGCKWFPASGSWIIKAKWVAYPQPKKIAITNILGMTGDEASPGYAEFAIQGQTVRLEPVIDEGRLFFMFKDMTTGKSTYPAGRFLYAPIPKDNEVVLDFNQAHNPPCAFTAYATCPLPPRQNTLMVAVEAGEMNYGHH